MKGFARRIQPMYAGVGDRISCSATPDTPACAVFIEENRMELANATKLNRKSGEHGAPVQGVGHCGRKLRVVVRNPG